LAFIFIRVAERGLINFGWIWSIPRLFVFGRAFEPLDMENGPTALIFRISSALQLQADRINRLVSLFQPHLDALTLQKTERVVTVALVVEIFRLARVLLFGLGV
jgi:hypothetical protein